MEVQELMAQARDVMTVKRVFGEPYEHDGVTIIPVAKIVGGSGGGQGAGIDGSQGTGSGFGLAARPAGVYVVHGDNVTWKPAVDVNRIVAGGQIVAALVVLAVRAYLRRRAQLPAVMLSHTEQRRLPFTESIGRMRRRIASR